MIVFHQVTMKNFLSVGNNTLTINITNGLHYVTGRDSSTGLRNGVGKSAVLVDSIMFALFGKTLRKSSSINFVNFKNKRNCLVTLTFSIDNKKYKIVRGVSPLFLKFTDDTGKEIQLSKTRETQSIIEDIIKLDFNACKNMLIMSINSHKHFMEMTKAEKRSFIEHILNVDVLGAMYSIFNTQYLEVRAEKLTLISKYEIIKEHYEKAIAHNQKIQDELERFETGRQAKINQIFDQVKAIKVIEDSSYASLIEQDIKLAKKNNESRMANRTELLKQQAIYETAVRYIEDNVKKLKKSRKFIIDTKLCPTCSSMLTDEHKERESKELSFQIEEEIAKINEHYKIIDNVKKEIETCTHNINESIKIISELESNLVKISKDKDQAIMLMNQIEDLKSQKFNLETQDITSLETEHNELSTKLSLINEEFKYLSLARSIFGDEGVKQYIIKQALPLLNKQIKYYLERLGSSYYLKFDETLSESVKALNRVELPYDNFSAGEQKRVDLALLLTFIDIARMQGKMTTNLLVIDEILDSSLDSEGIENFLTIIKEKTLKEGFSVYIISHRKEYNADLYDSIIILEKADGFTKIKDIYVGE